MVSEEDPFRRRARDLVARSKEGRHAEVREGLDAFLALRSGSWEHENKKAHVLAGMAYDALRQGDLDAAEAYLQVHRARLRSHWLLPTIVDERRSVASLLRHMSRGVPLDACPRVPRARKVAFVCPDNACLGPMAEAWARRLGPEDLHAVSGGLDPADRMPEEVPQALAEAGIPFEPRPPHRIPPEVLRRFPVVVGLNLDREAVLGGAARTPFVGWTVPFGDGGLEAVRRARDALRKAVDRLLRERRLAPSSDPGRPDDEEMRGPGFEPGNP